MTFEDLELSKPLQNAIDDLGFTEPTPIQAKAYSVIRGGKDVVGIAQTGTGKTLAYMLPILSNLKFSKQISPRVLVMVPTRELVLQVVEQVKSYTKYSNIRTLGVYGGPNIKTQIETCAQGTDILVATPGRLYDLVLARAVQVNTVNKLVIDEVDVMLDLGFRYQLTNILDLLPGKRQNIMFSATMTEEVDQLIDDAFTLPTRISIAVSGTPLDNIEQVSYPARNFKTKVNLLNHLLRDRDTYSKVLVFTGNKKRADLLFDDLGQTHGDSVCVLHANKTQNYRIRSIQQFEEGMHRIMVATDVMARGLDLDKVSHVISFDTPQYPENYMHRIGRTGRAAEQGHALLFFTEAEEEAKEAIETLMSRSIPEFDLPAGVKITNELIAEERPKVREVSNPHARKMEDTPGVAFHEKKAKNKKENLGGSYRREIAAKYKKPKTRGDKTANRRKKRK